MKLFTRYLLLALLIALSLTARSPWYEITYRITYAYNGSVFSQDMKPWNYPDDTDRRAYKRQGWTAPPSQWYTTALPPHMARILPQEQGE